MKVLVIGSGGREHALVWKIAQSRQVKRIFCAPGNGGISDLAECVNIKPEEVSELLRFAKQEKIDLTVVGPEVPLVAGIVDIFRAHQLKIFGPEKNAAQLEASKVFAKKLMKKYAVPTAAFRSFEKVAPAKEYMREQSVPIVIKADGLAQGKGVVVANSIEEAEQAIVAIMEDRIFGDAGKKIIIEECLKGQEASILVFTDGKHIIPLASSQDHKRIFEQDKGPNTGGMGAYSPAPVVNARLFQEIIDTIVEPTIKGLASEGIVYKGVLYAGVMITEQGPKALEFNVRFGDPETQAILPRLDSDLVEVMRATIEGRLNNVVLKWKEEACVCVVCASKGYPGAYEKAKEIAGLLEAGTMKNIVVFHAGTEKKDGKYFTSGGRVLGVTGSGITIQDAIHNVYRAVEKIAFSGMHFRRDIGQKALLLKEEVEA
ncbi:MAG: phosphoribosylamine--glycine ligase [Candidatus Omnitrophota bacterium]|jgi:phosphoribosylamine--glycine ligase|nr:MAG: phosphoribosylamine--glycine ligase [Candidatus Omnitrophota bacterium]